VKVILLFLSDIDIFGLLIRKLHLEIETMGIKTIEIETV
jgi:hypothetical protein